MGNTVSRSSHIRDLDPGVAKATRANTKRNTTGFSTPLPLPELPDLPSSPLPLPPAPPTALALLPASHQSALPHQRHTLAYNGPSPDHRAPDGEARRRRRDDPTLALQPSPLHAQRHASAPNQFHDGPILPPTVSSRPGLPENRHSFTYGTSQPPDEPYLAPDSSSHDHAADHPDSPSTPQPAAPPRNSKPVPPSTAAPAPPRPHRRERHPAANISFSRNNSASKSSSTKRPPLPAASDEAPDPNNPNTIEPLNDLRKASSSSSARRSSPFSQRVDATIDASISIIPPVREVHSSRIAHPSRIDKPPRARKVVSFNENVHVVTYPNDGSSSQSSAGDLPPKYPEGKPTRRRTRSVFRLLSKVAGPILQTEQAHYPEVAPANTNCFASQAESCCGLLGSPSEPSGDEQLQNRKLGRTVVEKRTAEGRTIVRHFEAPKELYNGSDLVVSYERARQTVGHLKAGVSRPEVKVRKDNTIDDDFDYNERRHSDDEDTLSLSDAHPSRDGIDEPEAIGDQLLSPDKETQDEDDLNSVFDIVPLWRRLKRVDELDVVLPSKASVAARAAVQDKEMRGAITREDLDLGSWDEQSRAEEPVAEDISLLLDAAEKNGDVPASSTAVDRECELDQDIDATREALDGTGNVSNTPDSVAGRDEDMALGEHDIPAKANIMYSSSSALDLGPSSDPLSAADPASDVDPLLQTDRPNEDTVTDLISRNESSERDCEPIQGIGKVNSRTLLPFGNATRRNGSDSHSDLSGSTFVDAEGSASRSIDSVTVSPLKPQDFEAAEAPKKDKAGAEVIHALRTETEPVRSTLSLSLVEVQAEEGISRTEQPKPVRSALSLLPGDDTSETSTYEERNVGTRSTREDSAHLHLAFNATSTTTADDDVVRDSAVGLDLDPLILPSHDDYSVAPGSPALSPLAGVFYGADTATLEMNSPDPEARGVAGLADYPEYEILKGQGNEDSIFGSEPNTPVLRTTSGWNEPFNDFELEDRIQEERAPLRHVNFEDRKNKQAVPEVLLHDWSGSMPVEPNVDIIDSAPNSRSSASYNHVFNPRFRDQQREFPNTAALLSARLNVDMSKLSASSSSGRFGATSPSSGQNGIRNTFSFGAARDSRSEAVVRGKHHSGEDRVQQYSIPNDNAASSSSGVAWVSSDYEDHSQRISDGADVLSSRVERGQFFTGVSGMHPPDPKIQDFQIPVDRKSFSDGYRRPVRATRGRSFAETELPRERSDEPSSDFRTFSQEPRGQISQNRPTVPFQRRRRLSNLETSSSEDGNTNPFRMVLGRLASGMHLAKKFVSSS